MNSILESFKKLAIEGDYETKIPMYEYFCHVISKDKKSLTREDAVKMREICMEEMVALPPLIKKAETFREKDKYVNCGDRLVTLFKLLNNTYSIAVNESEEGKINTLLKTMCDASEFDFAFEDLLNAENPELEHAEILVEYAEKISEEYQKGKFYHILLENKESVEKLSDEIKNVFAEHTVKDLNRYLEKKNLSEEEESSLELLVDVCRNYINEEISNLLQKVLGLGYDNINYYAVETLLQFGKEVSKEDILLLAKSPAYACLTYDMLSGKGMSDKYPKEYASPEYLAKSDMVHWLTYPTELGKEPDEIELLGIAKIKEGRDKIDYFIFKYKSDSDTLDDDLKNKWLIGWSARGGNTFSDFHLLSDFDKGTNKKTVKNIVKKILK